MAKEDSISVIIPALNEEKYLEATVDEVIAAANATFGRFEVIIIDDGSTDQTGRIADRLAAENENVIAVHSRKPSGLGGAYKKGLAAAGNYYVTLVNGENDIEAEELCRIWAHRGEVDIIIPYIVNIAERSAIRRTVSRIFTLAVNFLFGLRLNYFNHYVLHCRELVNSIRIRTDSYAYQAETLVKLIHKGHSYIEVGHQDKFDAPQKPTRIFSARNMIGVASFFIMTFFDVYLVRGRCRRTAE